MVPPSRAGATVYGPFSGKPSTAAAVPDSAFTFIGSAGSPEAPGTRRIERSLRGSNQIASASSPGPSPPTCTVVSSCPATT